MSVLLWRSMRSRLLTTRGFVTLTKTIAMSLEETDRVPHVAALRPHMAKGNQGNLRTLKGPGS